MILVSRCTTAAVEWIWCCVMCVIMEAHVGLEVYKVTGVNLWPVDKIQLAIPASQYYFGLGI